MGKGTPFPLVPTKKLVVSGPYAYCRNPIMLGSIFYYYGLVILFQTISGIIIVTLFQIFHAIYIKLIEEKELEIRFGKEYIQELWTYVILTIYLKS